MHFISLAAMFDSSPPGVTYMRLWLGHPWFGWWLVACFRLQDTTRAKVDLSSIEHEGMEYVEIRIKI